MLRILIFLIFSIFLIYKTSASSGTTYCGGNVSGECQNYCNVKNCLMGSCRSSTNSESPTCICGLCYNGIGQPNGPFIKSEDTGNLSSK
ncbi:unnamed protein product [Caenorhabditis nigoni]